jgi:hypothetical protein
VFFFYFVVEWRFCRGFCVFGGAETWFLRGGFVVIGVPSLVLRDHVAGSRKFSSFFRFIFGVGRRQRVPCVRAKKKCEGNGKDKRRSPAGMATRKARATATAKTKYRGPSPFDYAQGQDDDVKERRNGNGKYGDSELRSE